MPASTAPFGSWRSPITSDLIVAESISLQDVLLDGDDVYWIEGRPREVGRYVLVCRASDGSTTDINAAPYSARTRVHEYGGGGVIVHNRIAYASHFADQRLYRFAPGAEPVALTPAPKDGDPDKGYRYADGRIDPTRGLWLGVREDHTIAGREAVNALVAVSLAGGSSGTVLVEGSDFYSSPRLSPDSKRLAWVCWNHPDMPWVATELWVGDFDGSTVTNRTKVAGGRASPQDRGESVQQPEWSPDGRLYFISDRTGWWNLYCLESDSTTRPVCPRNAEFGQPHWTFAGSTYALLSAKRAVCTYVEAGLGKLAYLDLTSGTLSPIDVPFTEFGLIRAVGDRVAFRGGSAKRPASVAVLDTVSGKLDVLRTATVVADDPAIAKYLSEPQPVEFPTTDGKTAFGLYYPPQNPDFTGPEGERPPLLVKCHGGPTASASSTLDLRIHFWTSRGVAVIDVNYGGSTGFGREYRDRLYLNWGIVDVDDCTAAVKYLAEKSLADPKRAVISGGSAGGFTTLACLTFRDAFAAGGSHYGVSDLEALVRDTHKFESRYLDWLIGPYPAEKQTYHDRSPVYHADRLSVPVAFFQGDEDKIVPPNQTELMIEALRRKGVPVEYLLFAGEQHGFRKADNIKRALDAELYFFASLAFRVGLKF